MAWMEQSSAGKFKRKIAVISGAATPRDAEIGRASCRERVY
jgi:hypothetical protein